MKFTESFILLLALALFAVPIAAQTNTVNNSTPCSLATLNGTYGGHAEGTFLAQFPGLPAPPFPVLLAGLHSYDGAGHVSITYAASLGGVIEPWGAMATGTYSVNPDCTISGGTINDEGLPANFVGTITRRGMLQEVDLMYTNRYWVASGILKRTPPGGCSQQTLKGTYAVFGQGLVTLPNLPPLLPGGHVGIFTADGLGNFSGEDTVNIAGTTGPDTFTAKYTLNADCTFSAAITASIGTVHEVGTVTGVGRFQEVHSIIVEPGWVLAETGKKQ